MRDTAQLLAREKLFELKEAGFSSSMNKEGTFEDYPAFFWKAEAHPVELAAMYRAEIKVSWNKNGDPYVSLETLFAEP